MSMWFTSTLTRLGVTGVESANGTVGPAITDFTTVGIGNIQIPIQRHALVTNATSRTSLALTQLAYGHRSTTSELVNNTGRITVAILTTGEVIETFLACVAQFAIEIGVTQTLAISVTCEANRSMNIAITSWI